MEKLPKFVLDNRYSGMKPQRSILMFESGCKSPYTRNMYRSKLNYFLDYFHIKDFDSLCTIDIPKLKEMIEDYVIYRKNCNLARSTINNDVCAITHFFRMNDIEIPLFKAKKFMPEQKKIRGEKPYTTELLQQGLKLLEGYAYLKAIVHFLSSCGARGGLTEYLKIKHIGEFEKDGCKSVLVYADTKDEYYTFIHDEAIEVLDYWFEVRKQKGEVLTKDSWVFPQPRNTKLPLHETDIDSRLTSKFKPLDRGELINHRYDIAITYGMRKRWNLIAKQTPNVNSHFVEKMFSHNSRTHALDTVYLPPTIEQLFAEYKKFYSELYISKEYRLKIELRKKDKMIDENQVVNYEARIAELENIIKDKFGFTN
ncbi:hypothetical protein N9M35_05275 [Nitrosopumilus sp.]|nr:hypothetical protein [Nitrosopumilus sp.]